MGLIWGPLLAASLVVLLMVVFRSISEGVERSRRRRRGAATAAGSLPGLRGPLAPALPGHTDHELSMAVLVYLGVGASSFPTALPEAVNATFGARAPVLIPKVDALVEEAYEPRVGRDLALYRSGIEERMRNDHPELTDYAVWALGWCCSHAAR